MSVSNLTPLVCLASRLIAQRIKTMLTPHEQALTDVETEIKTSEHTLAQAKTRLSNAKSAHADVGQAQKLAPENAAIVKALADAVSEKDQATLALTAAEQARADCLARKAAILQPVAALIEAADMLKNVEDASGRGYCGAMVTGIWNRTSESLRLAKLNFPEIKQQEDSVDAAHASLRSAQQQVTEATSAHSHMQRALAKMATPANVEAEASTGEALNQATLRLQAAQTALATAKDELTKAQFPVQALIDLNETVTELHSQAQTCDRDYRQSLEDAAEARERERESSRDDDPCTCSENFRCGYCYGEQNRHATQGRANDSDPCR